MIVKIYDRNEKFRTTAEVFNWQHLHEINKLDVFTGFTLVPIEKGERIIFKHKTGKWYEFILDEPQVVHEEDERWHFMAIDSLSEIDGDWIDDKRPTSLTAAVIAMLEPTRWSMGNIASPAGKELSFYRCTAKEALNTILSEYNVELQTRLTVSSDGVYQRYIDILDRIGADRGKRYVYDKDVTSVKRTYQRGKIATALFGFGKGEEVGDGFGRRIDFSEINSGKAYVENQTALAQYGRLQNGQRVHVYDYVVFDDVTDKPELLTKTTAELAVRSQLPVTYEANVIDLGLDHENTAIGDTVRVIDGDHRYSTRVNYLLETEDGAQVRLANRILNIADSQKNINRMLSDLSSRAGVWDEAQKIKDGSYLNGLLDALNDQANTSGGWTFFRDGEGILTVNNPDPALATEAVNIVGGTIRVASTKKPDNTWNWRTFITGEVVAADLITAGILKGGKVHWNLETGVLYIGDSESTANLLWDGTSLSISQGAVKINSAGIEITDTNSQTIARHTADETVYVLKSTGNPFASYGAGQADVDIMNARKVYSPHVVNKVSEVTNAYVDATPTGDETGIDASNKAGTVGKALETALDGATVLNEDVTINLAADTFGEDIVIEGLTGRGKLRLIGFYGSTQFAGSVRLRNCTNTIILENMTVYSAVSSSEGLIHAESCADVRIIAPRLDGANNRPAITSDRSTVTVESGPISNCTECFRAKNLGQIYAYDTYGVGNGTGAFADSGSKIVMAYRKPRATTVKSESNGGVVLDSATATGSTFSITPPVWKAQTKTFTAKLSTANHSTGYVWKTGTWTQGTWEGTAQRGYADFGSAIKDWLNSAGGYQNISSVIIKAHRNTTSGGGSVSLKVTSPSTQSLPAVARGSTAQASLVSGLVTAMTSGALKLSSSTTATADYAGFDRIEIIVTAEKKA